MKKILFVFAICIPSFAMNSYETRLKDVENILYDEIDSVTEKIITPGLKTKVGEIQSVLYDEIDPVTEKIITPGLKTKVDEIDTTLKNEGIPGLKTKVDGIDTILKNEGIPGLKTKVDGIDTILKNEGIPGLKSQVNNIKDILSNEGIPGLKLKVDENITNINRLSEDVGRISKSVDTLKKDIYDQVDPETQEVIPGLKTLVKTNIPLIESLRESIGSISLGIAGLSAAISGLPEIIKDINEKIDKGWDTFLEEKFQEYMEVKKQVLDIITKCKIDGDPIPTYIVETAEQLQEMNLEMRRFTLSEVLTKLNVFVSLLDDDKLQSLQTYLDNTNVPKPDLKELQAILPNAVIEGEYVKVYGETRKFTRLVGFKTGLPKQGWMDQSCDYFAYGLRPVLEQTINQENFKRNENNDVIRKQNAKAQAAYDAGIRAAERVTFPADDFTTLVTDYNRLLTRHEI